MKKIKGFVTYYYKGVQYFEQPRRTHISKIEYNKDDNMSTVYLRRNHVFTEVLCIMFLLLLAYFVYTYGNFVQTVHMPKHAYCYDGKLYLNIVADSGNRNPVDYSVAGVNGTLNPGESLEYVDYTYTGSSETINFDVKVFGFDKSFSRYITISEFKFDGG